MIHFHWTIPRTLQTGTLSPPCPNFTVQSYSSWEEWPSIWFPSVEFYCRSLAVNYEWDILGLPSRRGRVPRTSLPHRPRATSLARLLYPPFLSSVLTPFPLSLSPWRPEISLAHFIQWAPRRTSHWTITLTVRSDQTLSIAASVSPPSLP